MPASENKYHTNLSAYFFGKPLWLNEENLDQPNIRKLSEQPWQQTKAEKWDALEATLCDLMFLDAKVMTGQVEQLQNDYHFAFTLFPDKRLESEQLEDRLNRIQLFTNSLLAGQQHTIPSVLPWSLDKTNSEIKRIINFPTSWDKLKVYRQFVIQQGFGLSRSTVSHILLQQAYNSAKEWIIHESANKLITTNRRLDSIFLLKEYNCLPEFNPLPVVIGVFWDGSERSESMFLDERCLVTISYGQSSKLIIWDLESGIKTREVSLPGTFILKGPMSISINGKYMVYGNWIGTEVWDITAGVVLQHFSSRIMSPEDDDGLKKSIATSLVDISANGDVIVSASGNHVEVWELGKSECTISFEESHAISGLKVSANGTILISFSENKLLKIWSLAELGVEKCIRIDSEVSCIEMDFLGSFVALGCTTGEVIFCDLKEAKILYSTKSLTNNGILKIKLSIDSRLLFILNTRELIVLDCKGYAILKKIPLITDHLASLSISADSKYAFVSSRGSHYYLDIEKGAGQFETPEILMPLLDYNLGPFDESAVVTNLNGNIIIGQSTPSRQLSLLNQPNKAIWQVSVSSDNSKLVSLTRDGQLDIYKYPDGTHESTISYDGPRINNMAISPSGRYLFTSARDSIIRLWDLLSGKTIREFEAHRGTFKGEDSHIELSPNGGMIVSQGGVDKTIRIWDILSSNLLRIIKVKHSSLQDPYSINSFKLTSDGNELAALFSNGEIKIFSLKNERLVRKISNNSLRGMNSLSLSRDDKTLYVLGIRSPINLMLIEISSGKIIAEYFDPEGNSFPVKEISNNKLILTSLSGQIHSLTIKNLASVSAAKITPTRIWDWKNQKWDDNFSAYCISCRNKELFDDNYINKLQEITKSLNQVNTSKSQRKEIHGSELKCSNCNYTNQINTFIVDEKVYETCLDRKVAISKNQLFADRPKFRDKDGEMGMLGEKIFGGTKKQYSEKLQKHYTKLKPYISLFDQAVDILRKGRVEESSNLFKELETQCRDNNIRPILACVLLHEAEISTIKGQYKETIGIYEEVEKIAYEDRGTGEFLVGFTKGALAKAINGKAKVHLLNGNERDAYQSYQSCIKVYPEDPEALLGVAYIAEINNNLEMALGLYKEVIKLSRLEHSDHSQYVPSIIGKANIFIRFEDYSNATVLLEEAKECSEKIGDISNLNVAMLNLALIRYKLKDLDMALSIYKKVGRASNKINFQGSFAKSLEGQAAIFFKKKLYSKALNTYRELAVIYLEMNDGKSAQQARRAVETCKVKIDKIDSNFPVEETKGSAPKNTIVQYEYVSRVGDIKEQVEKMLQSALVLSKEGKYDEEEKLYNKIEVMLERNNLLSEHLYSRMLNNYGALLVEQGKYIQAEKLLINSTTVSPLFANPHYWLAKLYQKRGIQSDLEQELKAWGKYLELNPSDSAKHNEAKLRLSEIG